MYDQITASLFKQMVLHGAACITREKQAINALNVFPVPDGDTGTNMSMTLAAAVTELQRKEPETVDQAASITASALLRGARGNSGVILSLLFRGISKGLKGHESAAPAAFAAALQEGVSSAYKAVMKPTEGTILTVSRLAAKRAVEAAAEGEGLEGVLEAAIAEGHIALEQTIDMNPVLKKAGVVDAGGKGFLLILEGMLAELRGEPMPEMAESAAPAAKADFAALSADEITFAFDTVFIVRKTVSCSLEPFREFLNGIGDSLVIGEDDEAFKVHVHTNTPVRPSPRPRSTAPWSWRRSRTCAPRRRISPPAVMSRAPTTWRARTTTTTIPPPPPRRNLRRTTASWPSAPARAWPPSSGTWAATAWSPAARP